MSRTCGSEWKTGTLGELVKGHRGVTYSDGDLREFASQDTVTLLRSNNIEDGNLNFQEVQRVPRQLASPDQILSVGDIAVCMSNGSRALVGKSAQLRTPFHERLTVGAFCSVFRPTKDADKCFVACLFQSQSYRKWLDLTLSGTAINNLRNLDVERFFIEIPPRDEQGRIGTVLNTLDAAILQTEAIIDKLKQVKQGLLHDLLTRGIDENGELRPPQSEAPQLYKQSPLGWIPNEWTIRPLLQCFPLQRGFDITKAEQTDGDVPVISSSGIASYHAFSRCDPPGVVIGRKGKLGGAHYVDRPYWPHDTTLWVTNFFDNEPEFCCLLLASLRLERFDAATSVPTLNRNVIHPLPIAMPCVDEQRLIVERINCVDDSIDSESIKLHKANRLKSGLMDDLLTGRVRVTPLLKL